MWGKKYVKWCQNWEINTRPNIQSENIRLYYYKNILLDLI